MIRFILYRLTCADAPCPAEIYRFRDIILPNQGERRRARRWRADVASKGAGKAAGVIDSAGRVDYNASGDMAARNKGLPSCHTLEWDAENPSRMSRIARGFWLSSTGPVLLARSKRLRLLIAGQSGEAIAHFGMDGHGSALSFHEVDKELTHVSARSLPRGNES